MKVAIIHEFLNQMGGAERVLLNLLQIWPDATLHVVFYDANKTQNVFEPYKKKVSFLNSMPWAKHHPKLFLPMIPKAVESFDLSEYDLVISDSSSFAKGVRTNKLHICYCHTPTRFLWTEADNYMKSQPYPFFLKWAGNSVLPLIRRWDYKVAQKVSFFIANSENVRKRIGKYYQRDSVVIPPPVDTSKFYPDGEKKDYFFTASRLEPYKKIELAVEAFNDSGLPLKVAGTGTDAVRLKKMAKPNIEFLGKVTDDELRRHYSEAKAFIFPAEEDAGIMVLEAQACGTPVIAYRAGGSLETITDGITGEFFDSQTKESIIDLVKKFDSSNFDSKLIRDHALKFDSKIFQQKIKSFVDEKYAETSKN